MFLVAQDMYFDELVYCPRLRLVEVFYKATFEVVVKDWSVGLGDKNLSAYTLTVVEREDCCALLTRHKWIVIHFPLLSASTAHVSCSTRSCSFTCALLALSRSALASAIHT